MTNEQLDALVERTARAWASMDGKAEAFDACKADPAREETEGRYGGYLTEAKELLRRSGVADAITTLRARAEAAEADAERLAEALYKEADRLFDEGYVLLPESVQALAAHNERKQDADEG